MRRSLRLAGTALVAAGALVLVWAVVVFFWRDPFTSLYTSYEQHRLSSRLDETTRELGLHAGAAASAATASDAAATRALLAGDARRYRLGTASGEPMGRIDVPRLGLRGMVVVNGTDSASLRKGPGRYLGSFMPGEGRLVYIAGHRTTYLAPFSHIDTMRAGDRIVLEMPYGTFRYRVTGHQIVAADNLSVLRPGRTERLALQACHPRYFASQRYIVWARLVGEQPAAADRVAAS